MPDGDEILTVAQVARELGVGAVRVRQLIAEGRILANRFGDRWLIRRGALDGVERRPVGRPAAARPGYYARGDGVSAGTREDLPMQQERIVACLGRKGGSGKTSTAVNLAGTLHAQGLRVLLVDLDPQASLTRLLDPEPVEYGIGACLADRPKLGGGPGPRPALRAVPSPGRSLDRERGPPAPRHAGRLPAASQGDGERQRL